MAPPQSTGAGSLPAPDKHSDLCEWSVKLGNLDVPLMLRSGNGPRLRVVPFHDRSRDLLGRSRDGGNAAGVVDEEGNKEGGGVG